MDIINFLKNAWQVASQPATDEFFFKNSEIHRNESAYRR